MTQLQLTRAFRLAASSYYRSQITLRDFDEESEASRQYAMTNDADAAALVPFTALTDSLIPEIASESITERMGARTFAGMVGNVVIPTDEGGIRFTPQDTEAAESSTPASTAFGAIMPEICVLTAEIPVSFAFLNTSGPAPEAWLRRIIARRFAADRDHYALQGSGVDGNVMGIASTPNVNAVSFAGATYTGASQTITSLLDDFYWLAVDNGGELGSSRWGYVAEPAVGRKLSRVKSTTGKDVLFPFGKRELMEHSVGWSRLARASLSTAGTTDAGLFFGDFSRMIHMLWGALEIRIVESGDDAKRGRARFIARAPYSVVLERPESFSRATSFTVALS